MRFTTGILFLFVTLVAGVVMFHRLGEATLGGDDCYYAEIAREMALTGDYLTTRTGFRPDFHSSKPPMIFWMAAAAGNAFGFTNAAMRLPAAVLGFAGVIALFLFAARYFNRYIAFMAAVILTFTQQYMYHARSMVTDGPFAVFFGLSLMAFWVARREDRPLFFYLWGFFAGCAVMTRQLPGFFIFPVAALYIALAREWRHLRNPHLYGGLLVCAAVVLPWHVLMLREYGAMFVRQYMGVALKTGIYGYAGEYENPSLNPWYAYGAILWSNYWPWFPFLIIGAVRAVRTWRTAACECRNTYLFLLLWAFVPLALFQAAVVKQFHFITPLYLPFALLAAAAFDRFRVRARRKAAVWVTGASGVLAAAYLAFPIVPLTLDSREFRDTVRLAPAARDAGTVFALKKGLVHYSNCFRFYADAATLCVTEEEIVGKVGARAPGTFVLSRDAFSRVVRRIDPRGIRVVAFSDESVLFSTRRATPAAPRAGRDHV